MDGKIFQGWQRAVAIASVLVFPCGTAMADAIDGNWCFKTRHLAIDGPTILTPGGRRMTGNYDRHSFVYLAPSGEVEAGAQVFIVLLDEETMQFRAGSETAPAQVWRRCTAPSS